MVSTPTGRVVQLPCNFCDPNGMTPDGFLCEVCRGGKSYAVILGRLESARIAHSEAVEAHDDAITEWVKAKAEWLGSQGEAQAVAYEAWCRFDAAKNKAAKTKADAYAAAVRAAKEEKDG